MWHIDTSVFWENSPRAKFIGNYIQVWVAYYPCKWFVVKISITSLISWLTLKLSLNLMVYDRNILRSSSKVFRNFQLSLCGLRTIFGKSSEIVFKWSKIFGKSSKTSLSVCLCNEQNNVWLFEDMEHLFLHSTLYLTRLLHSLVRYLVEHSKIYSISSRAHVLFFYFIFLNKFYWVLQINK